MGQGRKGIPVVTRLTSAEIASGAGNNIGSGFIEVIDANEQPTGQIYVSGPVGSPPAAIGAGAAGTELAWAATTTVQGGEIRRATVAVGTIGIGDRMASNSARTTGATFDAPEAANWTELPEDPDVVLKASVVNTLVSTATDAPLSAAQGKALQDAKAPLTSPTLTGTITADGTVKLGNGQNNPSPAPDVTDATHIFANTISTATSTISNVDTALRVSRAGTSGTKWNNTLDVNIGSHTAGLNSQTQVDFRLNNGGGATPDMTALTLKGNGEVLVSTNPVAALGVATKQYADGLVAGLLDYRGAFTPAAASGATGYPTTGGSGTSGAILKGDAFAASAAGFVLTEAIQAGDWVVAKVDAAAQTAASWDRLNTNISYAAEDAANKVTALSGGSTDTQYPSAKVVFDLLALKQAALVSGTNIKTINSQSLVGSGNLAVGASSASVTTRDGGTGGTVTQVGNDRVHTFLTSDNFVVPAGVTSVRILVVGGGGGGGSGGTGGNGNSTTGAAGPGGIGTANNIRADINVTYAAGGAGSHSQNAGHIGAAAAANTGNGGEGSYQGGTSGGNGVTPAGNGGSGIVIVRYIYQSLDTPIYANNAAAIAGGLTLGMLYRTGADPDTLCVVH